MGGTRIVLSLGMGEETHCADLWEGAALSSVGWDCTELGGRGWAVQWGSDHRVAVSSTC